ncbi:MAG: cyclase family protein [Verrucomicrobiales bacterium]|nr:cyclase family protein [Verrucomicrobiales bacterium]
MAPYHDLPESLLRMGPTARSQLTNLMCLPSCRSYLARLVGHRPLEVGSFGIVSGDAGGTPAPSLGFHARMTRVVDLTHVLDPDFPTYSGETQLRYQALASVERDGWNYGEWTLHEHTGTHLDAPLHRCAGRSAEALPAASLVGPLVLIDIRTRAAKDPDAMVSADDLRQWEVSHGPIPGGAIVAMNSGWSAHARTQRYRGADKDGTLHFPGFHVEAVEFLRSTRNVSGIAVDTLSLDPGVSTDFPAHTRWLGSGGWGLECVANLDQLPPAGAMVVVGSPKLAGASGGPSRVFAFV